MDKLTIKLLHERRNSNVRRKVDGYSGKLYLFMWSEDHKAYCYTTDKQEEADDLFNSQGRAMGSYFAPLITIKAEKPLPESITTELRARGLSVPKTDDAQAIALAMLAAYTRGQESAATPSITVVSPASEGATTTGSTGSVTITANPPDTATFIAAGTGGAPAVVALPKKNGGKK